MKYFVWMALITLSCSCTRKSLVHIYSPDRDQFLTVITDGDIQYLIDGIHTNVPDSNYVKLDISKKDLQVDNSLNVCWEESSEKYLWNVVIDKTIILKSTLDTSKYLFQTKLPTRDGDIPTEAPFRKDSCATISFVLKRSSPPSETKVVFK